MARREPLYRLIDELREEDLPAVTRVLQAFQGTTDKLRQVEPPPFKIRAFVDGLQPGINPDKMNNQS